MTVEVAGTHNQKDQKRGHLKSWEGVVVSDRMDKTVVVAVTRRVKSSEYGKFVKVTRKFHAHDRDDRCAVGDLVRIIETRPLSKTKRWSVREIVHKAENV